MALRNGRILDKITNPGYIFEPSQTDVAQDVDSASGRFIQRRDIRNNGLKSSNPDGTSKMPYYVSSGIGGRPCMRTNTGTDAWDRVSITTTGTVFSALVVMTTTIQNNYNRLMSFGQLRGGAADWNSVTSFDVEQGNGSTQFLAQRAQVGTASVGFTENRPMIIVVQFDGSTMYFYVNGTLIGTKPSSGNFDIQNAAFGDSVMGGYGGANVIATHVAEAAFWTTEQRQWAEGCAAWDNDNGQGAVLVADLPSTHPNKTSRPQFDDGSGGSDTPKSTTDALTGTETTTARAAVTTSSADTGTLAETTSARAAVTFAASDALTPTEAITATVTTLASAADTGTLTDTATITVNAAASVADTGVLTDTPSARAAVALSSADTGALSDTPSTSSGAVVSAADTGTLAEVIGLQVNARPAVADTGTLAEGGAPTAAVTTSATDAGALSDTATAASSNAGNAGQSDTGTLVEAQGVQVAVPVAVADVGSLVDGASAVARVSVASADVGALVDVPSLSVNVVVGASDTAALNESVPTTAAALAGTADSATFADIPSITAAASASLVDTWTYSENNTYVYVPSVGNLLADVASLLDVASVRIGVLFGVSDILVPVEAAVARATAALQAVDVITVAERFSFSTSTWYPVDGKAFPESPWQSVEIIGDQLKTFPNT